MRASAAVASILARLRTMPASCISASFFAVAPARDLLGIEAVERGAEGRALAQDRDPGEPRLEAVEHELLEQRPVVVFGHAPFLVVIGDIERIGARPGAALQAVRALAPPSRCAAAFLFRALGILFRVGFTLFGPERGAVQACLAVPFDRPGISPIDFRPSFANSRTLAMTFRAVRADKTDAGQTVRWSRWTSPSSWTAT